MLLVKLHVPDELLDWGRAQYAAGAWSTDWVTELNEVDPLDAREFFLARLEALVMEAVAAKRADLLVQLDLWTAARMGLSFARAGSVLGAARSATLTYTEAWSLAEAGLLSSEFGAEILAGRDAIRRVFRGVRVGGTPSDGCIRCGDTEAIAFVETEGDVCYCAACWKRLTAVPASEPPPVGARPLPPDSQRELADLL